MYLKFHTWEIRTFGTGCWKNPLSQSRQRWDDSIQMLHMKMYEDVSGFNWFRIASSGDSASVKLLCSVAQPVIKGGTVSHFTFMGPCIVNVFKQHQQDATLHNGIYYYKCSTCFRRFFHPSSWAQNCIHGLGYLSSFFCFLLLSWVSSKLTHDSGKKQKKIDKYPMLCIQLWALDDGRRNRLKHVEHV
jgi:hypothetical protein